MIKRQRKSCGDDEQDRQRRTIAEIGEQQTDKINIENEEFRHNDVRHDRADEESFFAFEDHAARVAMMLEIERPSNDRRVAANRASQFQTTPKRQHDCARITFHLINPQISQISQIEEKKLATKKHKRLRKKDSGRNVNETAWSAHDFILFCAFSWLCFLLRNPRNQRT
jgi:hypothetical protein